MMVTFISQCDKKALSRTRRVLDAFADRIGDNTWQTVITQEGLLAVKKLLRKTATKNTAVSCHWIRSRSRSELVWVVGNRSRFDLDGRVPVNTTRNDLLMLKTENNWHCGQAIQLLAQLAALLHDLGKASKAFQKRLRGSIQGKNLYRHEWLSLRLFLAFVGTDDDTTWLRRMMVPDATDDASWTGSGRFFRDGLDDNAPPPFEGLPPLASAVAWLVVTHHRLPVKPSYLKGQRGYFGKSVSEFKAARIPGLLSTVTAEWNEHADVSDQEAIAPYWQLAGKLPFSLPKWRKRLAHVAGKLFERQQSQPRNWINDPYLMHLSRLCLMLSDHYYSSLPPESGDREQGDKGDKLFANTHHGQLKQTLSEHLLGVARFASRIAYSLPVIEQQLPRLANHRGLIKRAGRGDFLWQDRASDAAQAIRARSEENGAFIVNMASTGCGKTLANARILNALARPEEGLRAVFALGLRTLTLQTGRAYRTDLKLDDDELAILVGGSANRKLFEYYEAQAEATGSASVQELIEEEAYVEYEGLLNEHPVLKKVLADPKINRLIAAPLLVCTIDHLMPATEAQRAGRQIAPMLRMMSSDLVLDELDDFDINDLPALTRIVHWAGLLGSRVVISSATLPPALVEGMYQAYRAGRLYYNRNRHPQTSADSNQLETLETTTRVPCLWVDEFNTQSGDALNAESYRELHDQFILQRIGRLEQSIKAQGAHRRACIKPLALTEKCRDRVAMEFSTPVLEAIIEAHNAHHEQCPQSQKKVSFGLVRMANIEPIITLAKALYASEMPADYHLHIRVYHARFPLLVRSAIENQLDTVLNRRQAEAVYSNEGIRRCIDLNPEKNHIFVVLGSPVTEVGRDHDYDWAVVEPSSMRSIIQLAGRVQRHRKKTSEYPNVMLFEKNLRAFYGGKASNGEAKAAFIKPGFELDNAPLNSGKRLRCHRLTKLLEQHEYEVISATPRIRVERSPLKPDLSLVDLEHARLQACMLPSNQTHHTPNAASCWQYADAALTWILPQQQPFRDSHTQNEETLLLLPDEDEQTLILYRVHEQPRKGKGEILTDERDRLRKTVLHCTDRVSVWGQHDLHTLLEELAQSLDLSLHKAASQFTRVQVLDSTYGWTYHPALGFGKYNES